MSSTALTNFDAETVEEINAELAGRKIELMNVVNVETFNPKSDDEWFRVHYWYVSELIR